METITNKEISIRVKPKMKRQGKYFYFMEICVSYVNICTF